MGRIEISTEIKAPIENVFAFLADPKNFEDIMPEDAAVRVEMLSKGPFGVGTTYRLSGVLAGRKMAVENEYVEFEENRRIVERQTKGDMKSYRGTWAFEATKKGTTLKQTMNYELPYSVLGKIIDRLKAGKEFQAFMKAGTERAKEILEKG